MNQKDILPEFKKLLLEFLGNDYKELLDNNINKCLQIILSVSSQAVSFVSLIEDEFDIEFDDEEIDIEFFSDVSIVANLIHNKLKIE